MLENEAPTNQLTNTFGPTNNAQHEPHVAPANDVDTAVAEETKNQPTQQGTNLETPEELVDKFSYTSKLGEGTYGVVYKAIRKETG